MTFLPKRRKRERFGKDPTRIESRGHLQWVRGFECSIKGRTNHACEGPMDAHHVKTRGAGGGDEQVIPLCRLAHMQLDSPGWSGPLFEKKYGINMAAIAAELWKRSPHRRKAEESARY